MHVFLSSVSRHCCQWVCLFLKVPFVRDTLRPWFYVCNRKRIELKNVSRHFACTGDDYNLHCTVYLLSKHVAKKSDAKTTLKTMNCRRGGETKYQPQKKKERVSSLFPQCTFVRVLFVSVLIMTKTYLSFSASTKVLKYWQRYLVRKQKKHLKTNYCTWKVMTI